MPTKLVEHSKKTAEAVDLLFQQKHTEAGLVLLYAWIDRMAWLSVAADESTGQDFKNWINNYLFSEYQLPCSADDLWAARCAILHTGSPNARDTNQGRAKRILYYGGDTHKFISNQEDTIMLKVKDLHVAFLGAIINFAGHLKQNQSALTVANEKLNKILKRTEQV